MKFEVVILLEKGDTDKDLETAINEISQLDFKTTISFKGELEV